MKPSDHKTCFPFLQTIISVPMIRVDLFQLQTDVVPGVGWAALFPVPRQVLERAHFLIIIIE